MFKAILVTTTIILEIHSQDISPLLDIKTLSELPLEKLLQVKNTFKETPDLTETSKDTDKIESKSNDDPPEALALKRKPNDRGGYYHSYGYEENMKKGGKKSVQSIFQISVTTLAFLAFGGYLLCLLVQAINGKSMMTVTTVSPEVMAAIINAKRKPIRRPVKLQRPKPYRRQKRPRRDVWPDANPENMYYALVSLSEAYTNYHTINYKRFNQSTNYFY